MSSALAMEILQSYTPSRRYKKKITFLYFLRKKIITYNMKSQHKIFNSLGIVLGHIYTVLVLGILPREEVEFDSNIFWAVRLWEVFHWSGRVVETANVLTAFLVGSAE